MVNLPADPVAVTVQEAAFPEAGPGYPDPLEPEHEAHVLSFDMALHHRSGFSFHHRLSDQQHRRSGLFEPTSCSILQVDTRGDQRSTHLVVILLSKFS